MKQEAAGLAGGYKSMNKNVKERYMKMEYVGKTLIATALFVAGYGNQAMAGSGGPVTMVDLQRQMQELIRENRQLAQRVGELEEKMIETNANTAEKLMALEKGEKQIDPGKISEFVTLTGLIEVEFATGDDFAGGNFNSFDASTVELGLDIKAPDWIAGHILLKYEEEGDNKGDFFVDEATITLGNSEKFPLTLTAGKFYLPFGDFSTNMIQDPLTLEIGEINDSGAALGFESNGFAAALYGYKGMKEADVNKPVTEHSDNMGYGGMAGYGYGKNDVSFTGGVSWTSNMADSDGAIADIFGDAGLDSVENSVNGLGIHLGAGFGPLSIIGEYITALDNFSPTEIDFQGQGAEPGAWNTELAFTTELFSRETVFAIGWQGTDEAVAIGLPESRYLGSVGMEILPKTALTLEYYYDNDYDTDDNGTGENASVVSAQLSYGF
jgi:hypothetical protein